VGGSVVNHTNDLQYELKLLNILFKQLEEFIEAQDKRIEELEETVDEIKNRPNISGGKI
jgi:hypothetical protein